ncbi:MAG: hypothetical protein LW688_04970 [Cryomorphaceae bacterium]|jgi:hypothetical protein|nr:hypothetical protein [Cryomorphaceae bacterium]
MKRIKFIIAIFIISSCSDDSNYVNGDLDNTFTEQTSEENIANEKYLRLKEKLIANGWQERNNDNGQLPSCYNFVPKKGNLDNSLNVYVGSGTDVAIKLMNVETEKCVRYVFINSETDYSIENIPEGQYYLKIAYGKDWLSKNVNGQCIGKFVKNPMYEKGDDILDFNKIITATGYSIPSYSLQLDVVSSGAANSFDSQDISEKDFNK